MATNKRVGFDSEELQTLGEVLRDVAEEKLVAHLPAYKAERLLAKLGVKRLISTESIVRRRERGAGGRKGNRGRPQMFPVLYTMEVGDEFSVLIDEEKREKTFRDTVYNATVRYGKKFKVNQGINGHIFVKRIA